MTSHTEKILFSAQQTKTELPNASPLVNMLKKEVDMLVTLFQNDFLQKREEVKSQHCH